MRNGIQKRIPESSSALGDLTLREINHRVANTLTLLMSGIRVHFRKIDDPELRQALQRHESQIFGIGELHRLLGAEQTMSECAIPNYFQPLCSALVRSVLAPLNLQCEVLLSDGLLPATTCMKLGMLICELVMNSAKHAFQNLDGGRIQICILVEGDHCSCSVSDNGVGLGLKKSGSGTGIVNQLARELGGVPQARSGSWGTDVSVRFLIQ